MQEIQSVSDQVSGANSEGSPSLRRRLVAGDLLLAAALVFFLLEVLVGVSSSVPAHMGAQQVQSKAAPSKYPNRLRIVRIFDTWRDEGLTNEWWRRAAECRIRNLRGTQVHKGAD